MELYKLARLALLGLGYVFAVKLADTLFHGLFRSPALAVLVVLLSLLAGLFQLWFFITLHGVLTRGQNLVHRLAASLAVFACALALLPKLLALARLLPIPARYFLQANGPQISSSAPWLAALLLFIFALVYWLNPPAICGPRMQRAFGAGVFGWFMMAAPLSLVMINYLMGGGYRFMAGLFAYAPLIFVLSSLLSFAGIAFFYLGFTRPRTA